MAGVIDRNVVKKVVVRKKEHFFDSKLLWFTGLIISLTVLIYVYPPGSDVYKAKNRGFLSNCGGTVPAGSIPGDSAEVPAERASFWLELGHDLYSRGLYSEAVLYYSKYLGIAGQGAESAALAFKTGDICKDQLKNYEQAAKFYIQVRYFDKESSLLQKTGLRIVACLEALGKTRESQSQLDQMTNIDRKASSRNSMSPIIAETGSRDFTLADIDSGIAALSPEIRKNFEGSNGRLLFLQQQLLMPHILYELGKKDGTAQSSRVLSRLEDVRKNLVVQEVINKKLSASKMPTDEELNMYFKANEEKYKTGFDENKNAILSDYVNFMNGLKVGRLMEEQMKIQGVRLYTSALKSVDVPEEVKQ